MAKHTLPTARKAKTIAKLIQICSDTKTYGIIFLSQKVDKEPIYEQSKVIFTHLHGHKAIAAISLNLLQPHTISYDHHVP